MYEATFKPFSNYETLKQLTKRTRVRLLFWPTFVINKLYEITT